MAAYLQDENIRPLTDKVTVLAPETVKFNIAFTYYVNLSDQSKAGTIQAEVAQAVAVYIEWQTRTIGRDNQPFRTHETDRGSRSKEGGDNLPGIYDRAGYQCRKDRTQTVTYGGVEND